MYVCIYLYIHIYTYLSIYIYIYLYACIAHLVELGLDVRDRVGDARDAQKQYMYPSISMYLSIYLRMARMSISINLCMSIAHLVELGLDVSNRVGDARDDDRVESVHTTRRNLDGLFFEKREGEIR